MTKHDPSQASLADDARAIWWAGVDAVRGDAAITANVQLDDAAIHFGDITYPLAGLEGLLVVGGGKAAAAMAGGLIRAVDGRLPIRGRINIPAGTADGYALGEVIACETRPQGSNEPTQLGIASTEAMLTDVATAKPGELVIVLLSGGGSALLVAPAPGISLQDKLAVTRLLSGAGATIGELNTVRKRLSRVKGGGLRRAAGPAPLVTLVLSDVIGDPLELIASGPTVADTAPPQAALAILQRYDPQRRGPAAVYRRLTALAEQAGDSGVATDHGHASQHSTAPHDPVVIIGNNAAAVDAAGVCAERLGYRHAMDAATGDEGTAEEVGRRLAEMAITMLRSADSSSQGPNGLITGGEPVVRLVDPQRRGRGGRNQQLVLAAMLALESHGDFRPQDRRRLVLLAGGTDGEDGPTDAAGAVLDQSVWQAADRLQLDKEDHLRRNDAYSFFELTGGLLLSGPTGTNVCDLRVVLVDGRHGGRVWK